MPVKTDRLLHLLGALFTCYISFKFLVNSMIMEDRGGGIFTREDVGDVSVEKFSVNMKFKAFLEELQRKSEVSREFTRLLKSSKFPAYFFETPGISRDSLEQRNFEFVLVSAESLQHIRPEREAFEEYFDCDLKEKTVTSFLNLGGDALLVVPCPLGQDLQAGENILQILSTRKKFKDL